MSFEVILILSAIVLLIALSAFFNVSETSLTAASRARMHSMAAGGQSLRGARQPAAVAARRR